MGKAKANIVVRNERIVAMYAKGNTTQEMVGIKFGLSASSICQILKASKKPQFKKLTTKGATSKRSLKK